MAKWLEPACVSRRLIWKLTTSTAIIIAATACSPLGKMRTAKNLLSSPSFAQKPPKQALKPNNPLHIATTYWATEYQKDPSNAKAALAYAKNLKALGAKDRAISILKQAHLQHSSNTEIASSYGRLLLEKGQTKLALRVLKKAEKPRGKTDWRVLSARGTAHAKLGEHTIAQQYFAAALKKKPNTPSLLNNLALSYAMSGNAEKAEPLLRRAIDNGHDTPRVRQNLALVLGLQKKFGEARQLASIDLSNDRAEANMAYLQSMVRNRKLAATVTKHQNLPQLAMKAAPERLETPVPVPRKKILVKKKPAKTRPVKTKPVKTKLAAWAPTIARASEPNRRHVTSKTMPLPWARTAPQAGRARVHTALAESVPLPSPKPKPSTPTTQSPAPAVPSKTSSMPSTNSHAVKARKKVQPKSQEAEARVSAWQTKVAKVDRSKYAQSLLYPNMD